MPAECVALFVPSLRGGGAERVMLSLALGLQDRGLGVDLVLARAEGPYLTSVPPKVRVIDLKAGRVRAALPALARYLRRERPSVALAAQDHANVVALWARAIARVSTRVVVTVHSPISEARRNAETFRERWITPWLLRRVYPKADGIVAVSAGVADDLARIAALPRERINVIYNPVIGPDLGRMAAEPLAHPWFQPGAPPVVLAVGRLTAQKDFPTLLRAFALLRQQLRARLMILGEGPERNRLEQLVRDFAITDDVAMPGFDANPYRHMAGAQVFALSSAWEALPTVLIEAMACGCDVVATDCPSGPREILDHGRHGILVPTDDPPALAAALARTLQARHRQQRTCDALARFTVPYATNAYLELIDALD